MASQRAFALNRLPQYQAPQAQTASSAKPDQRFEVADAAAAKSAAAAPAAQPITVTGSRVMRRDYEASSPVVTVSGPENLVARQATPAPSRTEQGGAEAIVLTASRISRSAARAAKRGDWNACTVDDPARNLDGCKREVNPAAKGVAGQAAARMAEGLSAAWKDDTNGAIAAFDAAIELDPKRAFAYLNRGIAYHDKGEPERAVEDFDKAISYAPYDARVFYHRSLALRALHRDKQAIADAERAVSLDPRYASLFDD